MAVLPRAPSRPPGTTARTTRGPPRTTGTALPRGRRRPDLRRSGAPGARRCFLVPAPRPADGALRGRPRPRRRPAVRRSRPAQPRTYDFRRPTKLSREHVPRLQIAFESFARQATTILTTFLRTGARMELRSIEQFSYDDYVQTLPDPVFITTFTLEPLAGKGMIAYPLDIAMAIVDHMLGGSGAAAQPTRPMTAMETSIITHLLDRLLHEFAVSFAAITDVQPVMTGFEYNPQLAQAASGLGHRHGRELRHGRGQPRGRGHAGPAVLLLRPGAEQRGLPAAVGVRAASSARRRPRPWPPASTSSPWTSACGSRRCRCPRPTCSPSPSATSSCCATRATARSRSPPTT